MKILAIGDFHGKFPVKLKKLVRGVDLVLCTGDFGGSDKLLKIVFKYFYTGWWKEVGERKAKRYVLEDYNSGRRMIRELNELGVPVYTVEGNWDFESGRKKMRTAGLKLDKYSKIMKPMKNVTFLNRRIVDAEGIKVYGFGGNVTPLIYTRKAGGHKKQKKDRYVKKEKKERIQLFRKHEKDLDVLLGHYAPYGFFDVVRFEGENPMNGKHIGFKPYTDYIKKYKPKLFICGHMHEYQGKKKLGDTLIVTTGSAKEGKCAIINYDEKKRKVKSIKFVK